MSSSIHNVMLLGAGGVTGAPILEALLRNPNFKVSAAVRASSTFTTASKEVTLHKVDYTSFDSLKAAFKGQDAIVSALTTFATPTQHLIIDAALEAGVKHFIPSEYGMDTSNPAVERYIPATKMKRDTIAYLRRTEDRMSWTALCVGAYFDWAILNGFGGYDFEKGIVQIQGDPDYMYEAINLDRIGEAVVKCLERIHVVRNQYVYVHSFRVSQRQVLDAMRRADPGQGWKTEEVDVEQLYQHGRQSASETELNMGVAMMIRSVLMGLGREENFNDFGDKATEWMDKLDLRDEDLDRTCRAVVAEKKA